MKKYIVTFNEMCKEDVEIAGGKGANLGELVHLGVNVPNGVVLTSYAYEAFMEFNNIDVNSIIDEKDIESSLKIIRESIIKGEIPAIIKEQIVHFYNETMYNDRVAVRSSATLEDLADASFAGQQQTYLNVVGEHNILEMVKRCYASLWGKRAYTYRKMQNYDGKSVSIAVVVQQMVESQVSGVMFTKNPTTNTDDIVINASFGLGEAIVSGIVTPDEYICLRDGSIKSKIIGSKEVQIVYSEKGTKKVSVAVEKRKEQALSGTIINDLVNIGLKIESHYCAPMDIEWAIKDGEIYILQARQITSGKLNSAKSFSKEDFKHLPQVKPVKRSMRELVLFNLEKIPKPYLPLDYDFSNIIGWQKKRLFSEIGLEIKDTNDIDKDGICSFVLDRVTPSFKIVNAPKMLKLMRNEKRNIEISNRMLVKYKAMLEREKTKNHTDLMSVAKSLKFMMKLIEHTAYNRFKYSLFPLVIENKIIERKLKKLDGNYKGFDLLDGFSYLTTDINRDIDDMATKIRKDEELKSAVLNLPYSTLISDYPKLKNMFLKFMSGYGYRSDFNCYCFTAKSWIDEPERFLSTLRVAVRSLSNSDKNENKFDIIMSSFKKRLSKKAFYKFKSKVNALRHYYYVREASQYLWECEFAHCRDLLKKCAIILGFEYDDLLYLFADELFEVLEKGEVSKEYRDLIERRKSKRPLAKAYWDYSIETLLTTDGQNIKGVSGSAGKVRGKVCVVNSPKQFYKLKRGDVLVCPYTDPEWTVLFTMASAVVVDTGGTLSHAAIVAREYCIPAVLATGNATKKLKDGDIVIVDGTKGEVIKV